MFAALSTIIVQGQLPSSLFDGSLNEDDIAARDTFALPMAYVVFNCLAFTFLFATVVLCIEVLKLASKFMINRARKYIRTIKLARDLTNRQLHRDPHVTLNRETPISKTHAVACIQYIIMK